MRGIRSLALCAITLSAGALMAPAAAGPGFGRLGTDPDAGRGAVALAASSPSWYTPAVAARVAEEGAVPAPVDAPLPGAIGIRPGSWMISPYACTMSFVFRSGGSLGIGTAGHCVDAVGQSVTLLTVEPTAPNHPVLVSIGTVAVRRSNGVGDDFALVWIRPELHGWVSPTAALVGGPCGRADVPVTEPAWHYGHGYAIGTGGTPRAGLATGWTASAFGWVGAGIYGDSGSPVRITSGFLGAGHLTHLVLQDAWLPAILVGTRISRMLALAPGWSLVHSSVCL